MPTTSPIPGFSVGSKDGLVDEPGGTGVMEDVRRVQGGPAAIGAERHVGGYEVGVELRVGFPARAVPEGGDNKTAGPVVGAPALPTANRARRILQVRESREHRPVMSGDDLLGGRSVTESPEERHGLRSRQGEVEARVLPVAHERLAGVWVEPGEHRPEILRRDFAVKAEERAPRPQPTAGHLAGGDVVVVPIVGDGLEVVDGRVGVGSEPRDADHIALGQRASLISRDSSPGSSRDTTGTAVPVPGDRLGRSHRRPGHGPAPSGAPVWCAGSWLSVGGVGR
jgi:hypothetical protein